MNKCPASRQRDPRRRSPEDGTSNPATTSSFGWFRGKRGEVHGPDREKCDPVPEFCVSNVYGRYGARTNVYRRKARREQKIDAAVALIMAIARCMAGKSRGSVYETRELQFGG
jgi:hypothetical protein